MQSKISHSLISPTSVDRVNISANSSFRIYFQSDLQVKAEAPTEYECRPYIEKALHELKAGGMVECASWLLYDINTI